MKSKFLLPSILCLFAWSLSGQEPVPAQSGDDEVRERRAAEAPRRAPEAEEAERLRGERDRRDQLKRNWLERELAQHEARARQLREDPFAPRPHSPPAKPWIIRTAEMDAASMQNLEEDFNVMSRLLERTILEHLQTPGRRRVPTAMGIDLQLLSGQRALPNVYVEGYGAIFFMQVDFPLLPPERVADEEEPPDHPVDSVWEQTRRELYGPAHPEPAPRRQRMAFAPYDQARVEALQEALIQAIRHGANMRGLAAEDWVTLTVFGTPRPPAAALDFHFGDSPGFFIYNGPATTPTPPPPSTLTLRVTKADLDALAEDQIDKSEFEQRVSILIY